MDEIIQQVLEELERRGQYRNNMRMLRDASNPFDFPDEIFRQMYRLNKEAALDIFNEIVEFLVPGQRRTRIPPIIRFFITLHFLAHGSYQKPVGQDKMNSSSQPSVSRCIKEVVNVLVDNHAHRYIRFPQNGDEIADVKNGFYRKHNIPGIIGCIDCTHIKIVPPYENNLVDPPNVFMNRKNFYSINCQLICDVNCKILHINARYPGSVHDAAIWMMSNIRRHLHHKFANGDHHTFLIGDSGYPLRPYLLTPIIGAQADSPEYRYSVRHKQIRNCIERTNGILKGVWRCLHSDRVLHYQPQKAAKIVYACAILHNIMRARNIPVDDGLIEDDVGFDINHHNDIDEAPLLNWGNIIRNRVVNNYFQVV